MHDRGKVVIGLLVFAGLATFPLWFMGAEGSKAVMPELAYPVGFGRCVADSATMRAHHMELLNQWRDNVVRRDERIYTAADGRRFVASLTQTCLGCHTDRAAFCDRCHGFMGVAPYCWDCHVDRQAAGLPPGAPLTPPPPAAAEATQAGPAGPAAPVALAAPAAPAAPVDVTLNTTAAPAGGAAATSGSEEAFR